MTRINPAAALLAAAIVMGGFQMDKDKRKVRGSAEAEGEIVITVPVSGSISAESREQMVDRLTGTVCDIVAEYVPQVDRDGVIIQGP